MEIAIPLPADSIASPAAGDTSCVSPRRDVLVDVARGIAITLVVVGHTNQGVLRRGWYADPQLGLRIDSFIYAFHMPAFFFLSGLFVRQSLARRTPLMFLREKVATLLYPYLLWAMVGFTATYVLARLSHQQTTAWRDLPVALLTGAESWFLPTLFFVMLVALVCRKLPGWAFFLLALVVCYAVPFNNLIFFERGVEQLPFFGAGVWLAQRYGKTKRLSAPFAGILAVLCLAPIIPATARQHNGWTTLFLALGFLGTVAVVLLARAVGEGTVARALAWGGSASIGIFLLSAYVQVPMRVLLAKGMHTTSVVPQILFPSFAAVVLPAWLYHRRKRFAMEWMFEWPF